MRRYGKTDANHQSIVAAFRKAGCSVLSLAPLGKGAPDLAVGFGGISILCEIKDGDKPKSAQELTPDQKQFWDTWKGGVRLVTCMEDVEATVKTLQHWRARLRA